MRHAVFLMTVKGAGEQIPSSAIGMMIEKIHFYRCFYVSEYKLNIDDNEQDKRVGIPESL